MFAIVSPMLQYAALLPAHLLFKRRALHRHSLRPSSDVNVNDQKEQRHSQTLIGARLAGPTLSFENFQELCIALQSALQSVDTVQVCSMYVCRSTASATCSSKAREAQAKGKVSKLGAARQAVEQRGLAEARDEGRRPIDSVDLGPQ